MYHFSGFRWPSFLTCFLFIGSHLLVADVALGGCCAGCGVSSQGTAASWGHTLRGKSPSRGLLPSERGLLGQLVSGRHFTKDARSHFAGSNCDERCPHCGVARDSREHRVFDCSSFADVRSHYAAIFRLAPRSALLYLEWQASLDALDWPCPVRDGRPNKKCFFSDGSCLFPAVPDIRVAASAVVTSRPGEFEVVWAGALPSSHQTIQRAEVLAGAVATGSALHPVVISDSLYFVRVARWLGQAFFSGCEPEVPLENADVWEFFLTCLQGCQSAEFVWVKAHRDCSGLEGFEQVMACGNAFADQTPKQAVHRYKAASGLYQRVVRSKLGAVKIRNQVDAFHLHLAYAAIGLQQEVPVCFVAPVHLVPEGPPWKVDSPELIDPGFHEGFVRQVFHWFCALEWYRGCSPGPVCDISWVELFLWWVVDSGTLPLFRVDGRWVRIGEDEDAIC